jgi:hypothetical protein
MTAHHSAVKLVLTLMISLSLVLVSVPVGAMTDQEASQGSTAPGAGIQAASWLATIPYGAVKVAFAVLGGVVGGMTYAVTGGNKDAAETVWTKSMYGTYILTPEHLRGEKQIHFIGTPEEGAKA